MFSKELILSPYTNAEEPVATSTNFEADELLQAFFSGKSPKTIEAYKRDLDDFRDFLQATDMNDVARIFFSDGLYKANLIALKYRTFLSEQRRLQPTSVNRKLAAIRSLVDMANTLGIITWKIRIKNQKIFSSLHNTAGPGKTGVQMLRDESAKRTDPKGLRDRAILHLLSDLALRRAEIVGLDLEDTNLGTGTLRVLGKGRLQKETLTLPKRTTKILSEWIVARGDFEGPLFINFHHSDHVQGKRLTSDGLYYMIKNLGKKTGQKVRPHGLRHTAITEAARKTQAIGMDLTKVLKFSRHKYLNTLQIYIDAVEGAQGEIAELVATD
ncbi:MAG: tyrosine-type recombinase/integrase [Desulfomonilaceae bacterium]